MGDKDVLGESEVVQICVIDTDDARPIAQSAYRIPDKIQG